MSFAIRIRHDLPQLRIELDLTSNARVIGLAGPSGAGKTTILNIVAGIVAPDEARIAVDDAVLVDTTAGVDLPLHRRSIGYVFQDARLLPHLGVAANLRYGAWFARRSVARAQADEIVAILGLGPLLQRRVGALSGGERQRVAFGRALLSAPRLLLMDEPMASLDPARKDTLLDMIERIKGRTSVPILYVSHQPAELDRLADQVLVIDRGRVADERWISRPIPGNAPA